MISRLTALERPQPLSDRAYDALRKLLREGQVPTGQPLQEAVLAAQLGVSRTPVREALARLAMDGLVVAEGRSFTAPRLANQDIEDIYALRFLLEPQALRLLAARVHTPKQLAPLRAALKDMAAAHAADDGAAFMDANYQFRDAWTSLVPNRRLVRAIEMYADHVRYLRAFTLDDAGVRAAVLGGLKRICAALTEGDGDAAARAMRAHLGRARRILLEMTEGRSNPARRTRLTEAM